MRTTRRARRAATRLYRACLVDGRLDERRAITVVTRVAQARRRGSLAVLSYFRRLARLDRTRYRAVVESAAPLAPDVGTAVEHGIQRVYGPGVEVTFVDNPALIGGMRLKVASDVYDGSVKKALAMLEERF